MDQPKIDSEILEVNSAFKLLGDIISGFVFLGDAEILQELKEDIDSLFFQANKQLIKETRPDLCLIET